MDIKSQDKERGKEKELSPQTPYKEKESQKENSAVPVPVIARARTYAGAGAGAGAAAQPTRAGAVDFRHAIGAGAGTASRSTRINRDLIMDASHDPVQVAMLALRIPQTSTGSDGTTFNNARMMRWALRRIGEQRFRELVYMQWRENEIDGKPRSTAAAFQSKLTAALGARGGAA